MRFILRLVAIIAAISVIATALFIVGFGWIGLRALIATGVFGTLTILGWIVTFVAGPMAAFQLFRFRNSGRVAALWLFGSMVAYYGIGLIAFRETGTQTKPILTLCAFLIVLIVTMLSPAAKRTCIASDVMSKLAK